MTQTSIPQLRFDGFTDSWEQRKLGEVATFGKGIGHSKSDITDSGTPFLHYGRLYTNYETAIDSVDTFANPNPGDLLSVGGEVVTPSSGETAEDIAVASVVLSPGVLLGGGLNVVYPKDVLDSVFTALSISWGRQHRDLATRAQGKSVVHLYNDDLAESSIALPGIKEQSLIGSFFLRLDDLITLHQRKLETLKTTKASMLDKMFPKEGEQYPEIRFDGFADPWEQHKLKDLMLFQNGFNGSRDAFGSGTPLISVMDVLSESCITYESIREKAVVSPVERERYLVEYGDVLFQRSSEIQEEAGTSNVYLDKEKAAIFGGFVIRGKRTSNYDPSMMKYALTTKPVRKQIVSRAQGAQHINISQDSLQGVELMLPSILEQERIGSFFRKLDDLIILYQQKLDGLKKAKEAFQTKMFI